MPASVRTDRNSTRILVATRLAFYALLFGFVLGLGLPGGRPRAQTLPMAQPAKAATSAGAEQKPVRFAGRGIFYFSGRIRCPLAGIGQRADYASNRLALDDNASTVIVDPAARRIVFTNTQSYPHRQLVGDVLLLGTATTESGALAPVGIHLKIEKKNDAFFSDVHSHPTVRDKLVAAEFEEYSVVLRTSKTEVLAMTPEAAQKSVLSPSLGMRIANRLIAATDNLEGESQDITQPNYRLVDVSISVGLGGLSKQIIRAQILALNPADAPLVRAGSLAEMLRRGSWELRLRALSFIDTDIIGRDLFLLGLDGMEVVQPLVKAGMEKETMLTIRLRSGRGTLFYQDKQQPLANPLDVARAYLEFNGLGSLLGHQVLVRNSSH